MSLLLKPGERGLLVGKTGSGKTMGATFLLRHLPPPIIVLDTKGDDHLPRSFDPRITDRVDGLTDRIDQPITIVTPTASELIDVAGLDDWIGSLPAPATLYIDELYQVHFGSGRAGPGLVGLLTRGRSRGMTTLMSTQRPAWISRFCLTETENFYVYRLSDPADRDRVARLTAPQIERIPRRFHFWFYRQGRAAAVLYSPVPAIQYREETS